MCQEIPADNGMLSHVQYLKELLESRVISALGWIDSRDMVADGATKGSVDRELLHTCMGGTSVHNHEVKVWRGKVQMNSTDLSSASAALSAMTLQGAEPSPRFSPLICFVSIASGSSSMQVPTTQQVPPVGLGSRQADEPELSGSRPGESCSYSGASGTTSRTPSFPIFLALDRFSHAAYHECQARDAG